MSANGLKDAQEAISEQSMSRKKKLSDINSKVEEKHML